MRGPRNLQGAKSGVSGGGWIRRIVIVVILLGIVGVAIRVPLIPCKTCAPGAGQEQAACKGCVGKGKLTLVRYLTGGSDSSP